MTTVEVFAGVGILCCFIAFQIFVILWASRFANRYYEKIDAMKNSLRRAGWIVQEDLYKGRVGVTARCGDHIIRAEAWSDLEAWRKALKHARALGLLDSEERPLDPGAVTKENDPITRFHESPSEFHEGR
jgi:hypothetical protein